jgi:hypothetical protein
VINKIWLWLYGIHRKKLKGQFTLYALFITVVTIIAYTQIYPFLNTIITDAIVDMDASTALIVSLSPLFIFLFILYSAMWYVVPHREQIER